MKQPWLLSAKIDGAFILAPMILPVLAVLYWQDHFQSLNPMPLWTWVVLILCVDVAHVYSTLFRTYLNPRELAKRPGLYFGVPVVALLAGIFLHTLNPIAFWRTLAYLAVFHFVRQQYGLMRLYSLNENAGLWSRRLDAGAVYLAAIYPLVYWHAHLPRDFHWFIDGDFATGLPLWASRAAGVVYVLVFSGWLMKTLWTVSTGFNLPKFLVVGGTALSWYTGIVYLNGDLAFTFTNVLSHGLPYIALIWFLGRNANEEVASQPIFGGRLQWAQMFSLYLLPFFFGLLLLMAYFEEGLWAGLVWREHLAVFPLFTWFPKVTDGATLSWIVPLLSLPQATHYILDGFIWRRQHD